ncbi:uncharacterized protein LOC125651622 isoform X1 [Ostrea edulis]|uniref:uncharacterized protein LOC125651622 isoform X1 n=1 Tax=Ostrea edulis TaxID=37623 RepID=UPI0024AE8DAA|nr:uncharacterized protein LOC125651622 isoform X1 [Ostrea edulis]
MSMSTTLRYELNTGNNMTEAFLKQQERIQKDEMMADRENIVRLEKNTNLRAEWNENLEKVSWNKRIQNESKRIQDEVRLAAKAAIVCISALIAMSTHAVYLSWKSQSVLKCQQSLAYTSPRYQQLRNNYCIRGIVIV